METLPPLLDALESLCAAALVHHASTPAEAIRRRAALRFTPEDIAVKFAKRLAEDCHYTVTAELNAREAEQAKLIETERREKGLSVEAKDLEDIKMEARTRAKSKRRSNGVGNNSETIVHRAHEELKQLVADMLTTLRTGIAPHSFTLPEKSAAQDLRRRADQ